MSDNPWSAVVLAFIAVGIATCLISKFLRGNKAIIEQHVQTALGEQADDWNEPSRKQVESDWLFDDPAFRDTPIYRQLRREEDVWFAASVLADIDELPGGAR